MRDGSAPLWMHYVIPALAIVGLVLLLFGCAVKDCGGFVRENVAGVECAWNFGRASE